MIAAFSSLPMSCTIRYVAHYMSLTYRITMENCESSTFYDSFSYQGNQNIVFIVR